MTGTLFPDSAGILDALPEAYVRLDGEFRYTFVNRAAERLLGHDRAGLIGKVLWEVYPELAGTGFEGCYRRAMTEGVSVAFEAWYEPWQRWFAILALPDSDGIVVRTSDITGRKRAEDALRASEAKFRDLFDSAPVAYHELDRDGVVRRVNLAECALLGYTPDQMLGRPFWEFVAEADRMASREAIRRKLSGEQPLEPVQRRFVRRDGSELWLEIHDILVRDALGEVAGIRSAVLDISERKREESYREVDREILQILNEPADLQSSLHRVLATLNVLTGCDAIGIRLRDGDDFPYCAQQGFSREFLLTENTLIERDADGGVCRDEQGNVRLECTCGLVISGRTEPANPLFTRGGSCWMNDSFPLLGLPAGEDPRLHPRNNCIHHGYASVALVPIRNQDGIVGLIHLNDRRKGRFTLHTIELLEGIAAHVGEALMRKRAEEDLRKRNVFIETVLENAPIGFAINTMAEGRPLYFSRKYANIYGVEPESINSVDEFFEKVYLDPVFREEIRARIRADIASGDPARMRWDDIPFTTRAGELRVVSAMNIPLPEQDLMISTVQDVTAKKALEAQFHQAQKMESVGRLAGGVAHDFNNLLTVINGFSRLLLDKLSDGDPVRETIAEIHNAGERAAGLTRQLLAFSRKQVLEPRRLDVNRVVEEMRPMLERLVGEDIEVRVALHAKGGTIHADPHQLEQVVMNLVVNARDAMPGVGKLLVETADVERDEGYVRSHPEARAGRYVMLAVADTGVGMDEETKGKIFEPFFTTKETGQGTGLGLSMVQGIVAQSGGYVEVHSARGKGTTFKIYLPALSEAPACSGGPAEVRRLQGKGTVLVVEDQAEVRKYTVAVLEAYGYRVFAVENAGEAMRCCERESIDLVLTDVVMPHVSGRELAGRLSESQPGIKVLFMSGYTDNVIARHGILDGGAKFIQKPFSPDELVRKILEVLEPPPPVARILVADDEAGVRSFLRRVLEGAGYQVTEAADGRQAVREARGERVDLVITDLVMPEQEGIETILALRRNVPGVRIIAISGAFQGKLLKTAQLLGADAVMAKPVSAELLLARVEEVLKTSR